MDQTTENRFPRVILASASPRRLDLLRQVGIEPEIAEPCGGSHHQHSTGSGGDGAFQTESGEYRSPAYRGRCYCDRRRYCGGLRWKNSWKAKG